MKVVLASNNPAKLRELDAVLRPMGWELVAQGDLGVPEAEETGTTFEANALLKARHAAACTGLAALADDSGIEVDALDGHPGVYSARYAGLQCDDEANNRLLLQELEGIPEEQRGARYQCVIALVRTAEDPDPLIARGVWEGRILETPQGHNGFGYDPLFYVPTHGCASAELEPDTKNGISHRGVALRALIEHLQAST
ncbi:MAG: RdgB/HAM1 family non-canonical purine NTP pyrophosphatase [Gammaproteobacteria bacterium]|nr:RdgB/HAM1 family non-canonical purine NTP pyrophosphatase [Gammaproteobacteria bacterium]MDE0301719.1 RdgB/HAM1 family non-canonical purine NTP pyrophosphatase [Gammaproteobacteria bacterium]MDE0611951.1 RdgB/HAM1 family non-canonical purine NTP pyrophosphatase [Gammaproteobacteria bacterium]